MMPADFMALFDWQSYVDEMPNSLEKILRPYIWKRRVLFFHEAIRREIINPHQAMQLATLHLELDAEQDSRDIG